jgi:hypothetical protein
LTLILLLKAKFTTIIEGFMKLELSVRIMAIL